MSLFERGAAIILVLLAIFTMPAMAANATSFLNITVTEQSVAAGTNITYILNLTNNGTSGADSYYVNITNTDGASTAAINVSSPVALAQDATQFIALNVTNTASGAFKVNVTATSVNDSTKNMSVNTTTTVTAVRAVNLTNVSATSSAPLAGTNNTYTLILTNNGTDPDNYTITVTNGDSASTASVNRSSIYLTASASQQFTLNVTNTVAGVFKVNVTATSVNDTSKVGYVNTTTSPYDVPNITTFSPATPVTDTGAVISRTFSVTVNQSSTVTYYLNGTNVGSAVGTTVTYTNTSAKLGTWNVTAIATTSAGSDSQTWVWSVPTSTMTSENLVTNHSTEERAPISTNVTLNFSWTDTGNITNVNFTMLGFNFSALVSANISSNLGVMTVNSTDETTGLIALYNATGLNNSAIYVNFTANVKTPAAAGTRTITVTTNKNTAGTTFTLYTRDPTKPYYLQSNNSVFTVDTETFGTLTTTISLIGTGVANLTFYAPNITGQTNITVGYGATNASSITTRYTSATNPNNTIYVITNGSVANPVITISSASGLQSSNLPYAVVTGGAITFAALYYALRRRRH